MTYDAMHHRHPLINALPGAIGTQVGYIMFARSVDWFTRNEHRRGRKHLRGSKGLLKAMRLNLRMLYRLERRNFTLWLRRTLAGNAKWRAAVLSDLGGERALRRWERRRRLAHGFEDTGSRVRNSASSGQVGERRGNSARSGGGIKTDASGMFRLAAVKAATVSRSGGGGNAGAQSASLVFPELKPIGLTPDELRGFGDYECHEDGHETVEDFTDPQTLWTDLLTPLEDAACQLAGLELAMLERCPQPGPVIPAGLGIQGPAGDGATKAKAKAISLHPD